MADSKTDPRAGFRIEKSGSEYKLSGVIDEHANLDFLRSVQGRILINLRDVRRINSVGVRQWMDAMRAIPSTATVELVEARPPIVDQINMVAGFLGKAHLLSFYAPMVCPSCDHQEEIQLDVAACRAAGGALPSNPCPRCGKSVLELDDVEEEFTSFLRDG